MRGITHHSRGGRFGLQHLDPGAAAAMAVVAERYGYANTSSAVTSF